MCMLILSYTCLKAAARSLAQAGILIVHPYKLRLYFKAHQTSFLTIQQQHHNLSHLGQVLV